MLTVFYGRILGINYIPQGTIELILRDDFELVQWSSKVCIQNQSLLSRTVRVR